MENTTTKISEMVREVLNVERERGLGHLTFASIVEIVRNRAWAILATASGDYSFELQRQIEADVVSQLS